MIRIAASASALAGLLIAALAAAQPPAPPSASAPVPAQPAAAAAPAASPSGQIPIEALAQPPYLGTPELSPDGNRIAAQLTGNDRKWIGIWDLRTDRSAPPRLFAQDNFDLRWLRWAGSDRLLMGIQVLQRLDGVEFPVTRILLLDVTTWKGAALRTGNGFLGDDVIFVDPGGAERGLPLILMPHGGPFARDSWSFDPWVQFLASRGYAVFQANFRGSTGFGRAYVERGFGQWGSGMIDDLEDGVDWLAGQGTIDPRRVCVMGASYGGYAALWAPIRKPDRYRCAISFAGISDIRAMLRYDGRRAAAPRYSREWRRRVEGEERTDLAAISPLQQAARVTVPLLIAHGERDRNVPPAQSRNLIRALARPRVTMESVFYPEAGHGFTRPQDSVDFLRRVEAFLTRHNPS